MALLKRQAEYDGLSERAIDILRLLAEGLTDRDVAERLVLTINTVKWYNRQIYSILGVSSRTQAIARARELHLLDETPTTVVPPTPTTSYAPKITLPAEATRFIGREREVDDVKRLLENTRLLTLIGSPGTGKTRLALHLAHAVRELFRDGVYFVSLAAISSSAQVANLIASAIEMPEGHRPSMLETLKYSLRESHSLLVLDNFEHVLEAAPQVSELLAAAPHLKVLATSREPLHLYGEQEYVVPPMSLPDTENMELQALAECESTALFVQQARAVQPDFALSAENALDVAKICVRLEGLPLAIELAAARSKLFTPQALLIRLDNRLDTLTGGLRDLPARQQTLRQTIDWSYNLLTDEERMLFARLAVFRGDSSLEAIEAICGPELPIDPFEGVESLLNKNLLLQHKGKDSEPRFFMLETLHEYALERLEASGESAEMKQRHLDYFVALAERAAPELRHAESRVWMQLLEMEHNNLLVALESSLAETQTEAKLRLIAALRDFWIMSGRFIEGQKWGMRAVSRHGEAPDSVRARALTSGGLAHFFAADRIPAQKLLQAALDIAYPLEDDAILGWALTFMGATSIKVPQEYAKALALTQEAVMIFREIDNKPGMIQALCVVGELSRTNGDDEQAQVVYEESLALARQIGEKRHEAMLLGNLGFIATHRGETERAEQLFRASLIKALELEFDKHLTVTVFVPLAGAIAQNGDLERAVRLFGATESLLEPMGAGLQAGDRGEYERTLAGIRSQVDADTFEAWWKEGRAMSFEQTVASALAHDKA